MQHARNKLLAGTALPLDQNRALAIGHFFDEGLDRLHLVAHSDQLPKRVFVAHGFSEQNVLMPETLELERLSDRQRNDLQLDRLGDEFKGAGLHGADGAFDGPVPGHDDGNDLSILTGYSFDDLDAVHALKSQVRDHHIDGLIPNNLQGRSALGHDGDLIALLLQELSEQFPHAGFVVHNDNVGSGPDG